MVTYVGKKYCHLMCVICVITILAVTRFVIPAAAVEPMHTPVEWYRYCKAKPNQHRDFDCSNLQLLEIPNFLPPSTVALDLSNNWIHNPYSSCFLLLPHLKKLILTKNKIRYISDRSFLHLENLEELDLSHNDIKSIPSDTFMNLKQLKILKISTSNMESRNRLVLETRSFAGLFALMELDLSNYVLLPHSCFNKFVSPLADLGSVSVSENVFRELFSVETIKMRITLSCPTSVNCKKYMYPPNLTYLDLSNSDMSQLCDISNVLVLNAEQDAKPLHLNLSSSEISHVQSYSFQGFQNLVSLNLSNNSIKKLEPYFSYHLNKLQSLDVSRSNLQYISSIAFTKLSNLLQLNLENNIIQSIPPHTFSSLLELVYLDLSNNEIESLSLSGLLNLKHLDLSRNEIVNIGSNGLKGLSELTKLKYLDLCSNAFVNINADSLQGLSNLQYLNLSDTRINTIAPQTFSDLHNLVNLEMDMTYHQCYVANNESSCESTDLKCIELSELFNPNRSLEDCVEFDHDYVVWLSKSIVCGLQTVSIQRKLLKTRLVDGIHTYYFLKTYKASTANLIEFDTPLIEVKYHTWWLKSGRQEVVMHSVIFTVPHGTMPQCEDNEMYIRIPSLHYRGFDEIVYDVFSCFIDLKSLYLNNSVPQLSRLESDAFSSLYSLEILDLSNNNLTFVEMTTFCALDNLKHLNLAANFLTSLEYCFPCALPLQILDLSDNPLSYLGKAKECYHRETSISFTHAIQTTCYFAGDTLHKFDVDNLNVLKTTDNKYIFSFQECNATNLVVLDMSNTSVRFKFGIYYFPSMTHMTVQIIDWPNFDKLIFLGKLSHPEVKLIVPSLTYLDISHSSLIMNKHNIYFLDTKNLRHVDLSFTAFKPISCKNHTGVFFENFTSLEYLNISNSGVMTLCDFYFQRLPMLTFLDASNNNISLISGHLFDRNKHLTLIDLSNNYIFTLEPSTFNKLINLVQLYFENNPLDCTYLSEMQDFMKLSTDISFTRDDSLPWQTHQCAEPQYLRGKPLLMEDLTDYKHIFYIFRAIVVHAFCTLSYFCWRKRWYILFYTYKKISKLKQHYELHRPVTEIQNLKYDAYVSYSNKDNDFVEEKLTRELENREPSVKLCIHERDFVLGKEIFGNITDEMKVSRKFLFIVSREFVKSRYCNYEMEQAFHMSLDLDLSNGLMLFVILEQVPQNEMSDVLKFFVNTNTYLDWPSEVRRNGEQLSFRKLKNALLKKEKTE